MPEIMQLGNTHLLCIYGEMESNSACPDLQGNRFTKVALPGAHHFDGNYTRIIETILREMKY